MRVSKLIRWILYILGGIIAGIILILIVLAFVPITIDLSEHKGMVESAATMALGRSVQIDDKIIITTSLQPYFSFARLRIANLDGFQAGDFLRMKEARIGIRVLPLLKGKLHITEIRVDGLSLLLVENEKGATNWTFSPATESKSEVSAEPKSAPPKSDFKLESDSLVLADLILQDISVNYRNPGMKESLQFKIEECKGSMKPGQPFTLDIKGKLLNEPYTTEVEIGSLEEFLQTNRSWLEIKMNISKTSFAFAGDVDLAQVNKILKLKAEVAGDRLDSLNGLLNLDLPPLKSYRTGAQLTLQKKRADLSDFEVQVGRSKMVGKMTIDNSGKKSKSSINLRAPLIQLNDFDLGDWSPKKSASEKTVEKNEEKKENSSSAPEKGQPSTEEKVKELLNPEVLAKFEVKMDVTVDQVLSGSDELGSGSLTAMLKDGRVSIDPVKLNIPGGSFSLAASLKPDRKAPEASVQASVENFDFGVLVRRTNPEADMGGLINLDVDIKSSADSFEELMASGNGYFDFSGHLENLKAGIIDLWAVNVIAAVISNEKEDASKINCVVGRLTLKDGLIKPNVLVIDTSKIRICGKGQVDFKEELIDLKMAPIAKRPEYFSLATPIEVKGKFTDFGVGIQAGGLVGTAVKFIVSPVTTTLKRIVGTELPADGKDVCATPIGPENRSAKPPAGCN